MIKELALPVFIRPIHQNSQKCPRKEFFRDRLGLVPRMALVRRTAIPAKSSGSARRRSL